MPVRRHLLAGAAVVVLVPVLAGCGRGSGAGGPGSTRVDAIFDNASFVNAGQDVRVAGATVGKVTDVELTKDRKARISMDIDKAFLPFRKDADCTILPQSLIGEKFVECDPGMPSSPQLTATGGSKVPTLPVTNTHSPVDLDLVVAMLGQPTNVRTQLLLNEFGGGFATRGKDLDDTIRRSNPTLKYAQQTLTILERDKQSLGRVVEASDTILSELDRRKDALTGTFENAASTLKVTSDYHVQLDRAIKDLPPTLSALRPALHALSDLSGNVRPTLVSLRQSSPALSTLAGDLGPLTQAARPAFKELATASKIGVPILNRSLPELQRLQTAVSALAPITPLGRELSDSLSDNGVPENLALFVFNVVMATARKDDISHIVPANVVLTPCLLASTTPTPGCEAKFTSEANGNNVLKSAQTKAFDDLLKTRGKALDAAEATKAADAKSGTAKSDAATKTPASTTSVPATKEAGR